MRDPPLVPPASRRRPVRRPSRRRSDRGGASRHLEVLSSRARRGHGPNGGLGIVRQWNAASPRKPLRTRRHDRRTARLSGTICTKISQGVHESSSRGPYGLSRRGVPQVPCPNTSRPAPNAARRVVTRSAPGRTRGFGTGSELRNDVVFEMSGRPVSDDLGSQSHRITSPAKKTATRSAKHPTSRTLSASHKCARPEGRTMFATVDRYLAAVSTPRRRGRNASQTVPISRRRRTRSCASPRTSVSGAASGTARGGTQVSRPRSCSARTRRGR